MASETYYFFFSIIFVLGITLWITNLIYLRKKGKTTYGLSYKPGTPEYRRVIRLASNRNISIASIVAVIFVANLVYDIRRLMRMDNQNYAHGIFLYAPITTILFFIVMTLIVRSQLKKYR